jgi:SH3-like domain-containing protein
VAALRREPTDAARIPGKPGAREVSNYLATLHRGEKVAVLETREDWARVRTSDDSEGWMKRSTLLEQDGVTEATVLAPADVFDRPDLLAANARRKVEAGTLVLVVKARPPFSEVNVSGSQDAWVLTDRLDTTEKEVSVAKLVEKSRYLVRNGKKDEALQLLGLARQHFEGAALVNTLAAELGEAPPAAPAAGTEPPPAGQPVDPAPPGAAAAA